MSESSRSGFRTAGAVLALVALLLLFPTHDLVAQGGEGRAYPLRHYTHVFLAYALAWALLLGWLLRIVGRLREVEERLTRVEEEG